MTTGSTRAVDSRRRFDVPRRLDSPRPGSGPGTWSLLPAAWLSSDGPAARPRGGSVGRLVSVAARRRWASHKRGRMRRALPETRSHGHPTSRDLVDVLTCGLAGTRARGVILLRWRDTAPPALGLAGNGCPKGRLQLLQGDRDTRMGCPVVRGASVATSSSRCLGTPADGALGPAYFRVRPLPRRHHSPSHRLARDIDEARPSR